MKANLLRIGNLLSVGNYDVKVVEIHHLGVRVWDLEETQDAWERFSDRIKPIPLTEEWLLKFGFVEKNIGNKLSESWYELKYLSNEHEPMITSWVSILINIETWSCVICDEYPEEIGANTKTKIEYVHQLQNLYFALVGEELTFKSE
jgi:hypothetical protein